MTPLWLIPFALQGGVMAVDEFYCHTRRGLPRWERLGHPLDTLSVILCFGVTTFLPATQTNLSLFLGLSIFSCLFISKDEFVHQNECDGFEHWLHSLLFILHPITFLGAALFWMDGGWGSFLRVQFLVLLGFLSYQIIYWSYLWKQSKSTIQSTIHLVSGGTQPMTTQSRS